MQATTQQHCSPSAVPDAIQARIQDHPCFSEDAHHHYARMHVAVAPACNIQCHYCNRKYDCSNESRPGVVSEVLTPTQAANKVLAVAAAIPQLSVVGIAGPGDPLANPERTFATFRELSRKAPDLKLCVSTNGLALPQLVDDLCQHNIDHVTITINCVDPAIGAQIYPWILWNKRRVTGIEAARILIEQQQQGLEQLVARGVLVKVNSVLIPGINDAHLSEVSRVIKAKGAFLHNVMPLISAPEYGTHYGLTGQREPTTAELQAVQERCSGDMKLMRHCRQCRADAIGLLGEDRRDEFTLDKIADLEIDYQAAMQRRIEARAEIETQRKAAQSPRRSAVVSLMPLPTKKVAPRVPTAEVLRVAVATRSGERIDEHFGQAVTFTVYDVDANGVREIEQRWVEPYCDGPEHCASGDETLQHTLELLADCQMVLCSRIGFAPWQRLEAAGILPNGEYAMSPIATALAAVYREQPVRRLSAPLAQSA